MKQVAKYTEIPKNSLITSGFDRIDYSDTYRIAKSTDDAEAKRERAIRILDNITK